MLEGIITKPIKLTAMKNNSKKFRLMVYEEVLRIAEEEGWKNGFCNMIINACRKLHNQGKISSELYDRSDPYDTLKKANRKGSVWHEVNAYYNQEVSLSYWDYTRAERHEIMKTIVKQMKGE